MMIFLKLLLSSGLIFIAVTAFIRNESLCYRPSNNIKPMHYDIKLTSYIEENIFYGEYNISINILDKTQHIYLHSKKLCIGNIVIITNFKKYQNDKDIVYKPTYNTKENSINISFINELSPGSYILNIEYFGTADKGFRIFDMEEAGTAWVGALHFQIIGGRHAFPCWHRNNLLLEPTFNISLRCHNCTTLSNMPLRNTEKDKYNFEWKHYNTTPVMMTHHVTMVVSNHLFPLGIKTQNIEMWCRLKSGFYMEFAKNVTENITLHFKHKWKRDIIWNVNYVAIPNFPDKDINVFGLVLYRETDIIYDKKLCPVANKIEVAQSIGRKVTWQWFIDMMDEKLVSDFWFKEGLITLLATYAVNKTYPDNQIINLFVVQNQHYSFNLDGYYMWPSTSQVNSSLEIPNSIRAPFILRMMQHVLTDKIFEKGIKTYVNRLYFNDFMDVMRLPTLIRDYDILLQQSKMKDWALEKHCPLIKVERNYSDLMSPTHVRIQYNDTLKIRCISVTFTTQTFLDFNNFNHYMVCAKKHLKLSLPFEENGWMIFNIQQTGELTGVVFWNVIIYLQKEEDYIPWYPMFKALEYLSSTFIVVKEEIKNFTSKVRQILHEILKRIKYGEIDDTDELRICLRQEAARWACFFGDITCKTVANNKLKQHLQDPAKYKLLPWWKEWTYCKGLMTTIDETTWQLVYTKGLNKSDSKFLEYLACPEDFNLIKNYLTFKQNISTKQDYPNPFNSFLHIITKHAKNSTILQHILYNLHRIKPKNVSITAAFIIIINNVYSVNQTQEINNYLESIKDQADLFVGINFTEDFLKSYRIETSFIGRISDKIESRISIRNKQIKRQRDYFGRFFW
ncbi:thyrotropin-releasing hormone-degrading ectoenzyme-like isoform X2 [Nylanderia fulva]|uniref:thyrotropin-releasing hormone-degrading ectoenzyme-like isoform X2 n=1 Tax=Nylanderia fulva TaxID=613905 RepID=UPI0010FB119D|nr:thyrotropin-releasing hormone-degrading ectoenzyme-like isoform X2 [Nylanderia fulva]